MPHRPPTRLLRLQHLGVTRNLTVFFVVVFWLATAFWVYKDARRRIDDPVARRDGRRCSGSCRRSSGRSSTSSSGRPESIEERRERELENRAIEERLAERDLRCPVCRGAGRRVVPRLPRLHDAAQAGVRRVRLAARADLAGVPVLRDAGPAGRRARATRCCSRCACDARADAAAGPPAACAQPDCDYAFAAYGHRNHTRPRQAGRRLPRALRRDRLPLRASRLRAARRPPAEGHPRARAAALRRAQGQAVLRRARLVHHLGPGARARRPRRERDRSASGR